MNFVYAALMLLAAVLLVFAAITRIGVWHIERRNPPVGEFAIANGTRLHYVIDRAGDAAEHH